MRAVGFWDRARSALGLDGEPRSDGGASARPASVGPRKKKDGRPPLPEAAGNPAATLEDVLAARAAGDPASARAILAAIDKGQGLRTVLRAAAALEAGESDELDRLLPAVRDDQPAWQLRLQIAAALDGGPARETLVRAARERGAPAWALAWVRALSADDAERRGGLVDLLFEDAALARTVAARDVEVPGVKADNEAIRRYSAFAHGRDVIRKFGASQLVALVERIDGRST